MGQSQPSTRMARENKRNIGPACKCTEIKFWCVDAFWCTFRCVSLHETKKLNSIFLFRCENSILVFELNVPELNHPRRHFKLFLSLFFSLCLKFVNLIHKTFVQNSISNSRQRLPSVTVHYLDASTLELFMGKFSVANFWNVVLCKMWSRLN